MSSHPEIIATVEPGLPGNPCQVGAIPCFWIQWWFLTKKVRCRTPLAFAGLRRIMLARPLPSRAEGFITIGIAGPGRLRRRRFLRRRSDRRRATTPVIGPDGSWQLRRIGWRQDALDEAAVPEISRFPRPDRWTACHHDHLIPRRKLHDLAHRHQGPCTLLP